MAAASAQAVAEETANVSHRRRLEGVRVLLVVPTLGLGGAERQAFLLARELARQEGASVRLVSLAPSDIPLTLTALCEREGVTWDRFTLIHKKGERLRQLWDLMRFVRYLRRERPDVLLPYCMFPNVVSALTWKLGGVRVCFWNQRDEGRSRVARWVEQIAVRRIRTFLTNSSHGGEFLVRELGVAPEQVRIVHNGIELREAEHDRGSWRRRLRLPETAFVACMMANLHGYKDHQTLIAAWRIVVDRLRECGRDAHLLLAGGSGDRHEAVQRQVEQSDLRDYVHLLGVVTDVTGLFRAVDLAVFSSYNEGLPNAVLEAMSAGLAVAATDYPGIREAIGPAGQSLLAQARDPHDLADKIVLAAENPRLRHLLGAQGQIRVGSEFSVEGMARSTADIMVAQLTAQ